MAKWNGANWRPVARYLPDGPVNADMVRYDCAVIHIEDGEWSRNEAFNWYNTAGHAVPQFRFHTPTSAMDQYIDSKYRGSATLNGNHRVIAVECHGLETNDKAKPLTQENIRKLALWLVWCHKTHGIPLKWTNSSKPDSRGVTVHRKGIDGNFPQPPGKLLGGRVAGGEYWSKTFGKTCPTSTWIKQIHDDVLPLARRLAAEDTPLTPEDKEWVKAQIADAEKRANNKAWDIARTVFRNNIQRLGAFINRTWEDPPTT